MRLLRSTAIIASFTLMSRVLGLVRDVFIARFMGAGGVTDAFFTAFKLPNIFRRMFAEGAFSAAFIPLYARYMEEDGIEAADAFARESMAALIVAVAALVIFFEMTMPWTLSLIGFGLDRHIDPQTGISPYYLAVLYAQVTMPYLIFMSLTSLFSGILNTRNFFALAASVHMILNIFMILVLTQVVRMGWSKDEIGLYLSIAVTLAGIGQMATVLYGCRRAGVKIGLQRPRMTPRVKRLLHLSIPGSISAGITQINLLASNSIATIQNGAASWLTYADRLYQLPLGMIGIAMGIALLPSLSRRLRAGDEKGAKMSLNRALEISAFLTIPAAIALFVIPEFLISGLFERGAFTSETTSQTAKALRFFALGLPAFVLIKVFTPVFFAHENMKTPMIFAGLSMIVNISVGLILFFQIGFAGLALATTIAAWINVGCLVYTLLRQNKFSPDKRLLLRVPPIILSAIIMGGALYYFVGHFPANLPATIWVDFLGLAVVCGMGGIIYALSAFIFRAFNINDMRDAFRRAS